MTLTTRVLVCALGLSGSACGLKAVPYERRLERSFVVAAGSIVSVNVSGGSVVTGSGQPGVVRLVLREEIFANSEDDAKDLVSDYDVVAEQEGADVRIVGRRKPGTASHDGWLDWRHGVRFSATLEVPPDVRLDLRTSGGSVAVQGSRTASLRAETSGGSIRVQGGSADMVLNTSGGSIDVGRALGPLTAKTSGGSIRVGYVGASATPIALNTSGGSIRADVDRDARLDMEADTSGGSVNVSGLDGATPTRERPRGRGHFSGAVNGGGGAFRAHTSGGSITIRGAEGDWSEPAMRRGA